MASDRDAFLSALDAAAASLGFGPVLRVPRLLNTLEVEALFPGATSWTVVFADAAGAVLHVDAVFAPGSPGPPPGAPAPFGMPEIDEQTGLAYLLLKRLRKGDREPASWSRFAGRPVPVLERELGRDLADRVAQAAGAGEVPSPELIAQARRALRRRRALSPRAVAVAARAASTAVRRVVRPSGAFVALGGVDGSGKSAIADALFDWSPFRHALRLHARPGVLKPLGWYVGKASSDGSDPHGAEPWGPAMSAVRLGYFWVDFAVGYWARIWPVRARGGLVVSERWWWDMYVDPTRQRIQPMPRAARLLGRLVPRADAFLLLDAPGEQIHRRKQELTTAEIERQREAWGALAPAIANLRTIDATPPLPEVTDDVITAVMRRQRTRLGGGPRLVAFPRHEPRWLVDPHDRESMRAALRLYLPSRRRAVGVARAAGALGAPAIRALGGPPPDGAARAADRVRAAAARHVPGERVRLTGYLGSPGPLQKFSAVVLDAAGAPALYAKVGNTPATVAALRNEADALAKAREVVRSAALPEVLEHDEGLLLLSAVAGERFDNRAPAGAAHLRLLEELHADRIAFDWAAHRDALLDRHGDVLGAALRATHDAWPSLHWAYRAHGDLTPWNCLDRGGELGVVDWEMSGHRLPGWDALHYLVQIEAVTHQGPIGPAVDRILGAPFLAQARAVAADEDLPWNTLQLLVLIDGAARLLATQPELSARGIAIRAHAIERLLR